MKLTVAKVFTFDAAHFLKDYVGDCGRMHGHTYKLEVTVLGSIGDDMVIDFKDLKNLVKMYVLDLVDHQNLNEVVEFKTTAENLAVWIFNILNMEFLHHRGITLSKIRLWETPNSYAEVST